MKQNGQSVKRRQRRTPLNQDPAALVRWRRRNRMTITEAAQQARCTVTHLSKVEHGHHGASWDLLERLAAIYGCTDKDLQDRTLDDRQAVA